MLECSWFTEYEHSENDCLEQGDVLLSCSYPVRDGYSKTGEINIALVEGVTGIVLTQSCDLAHRKTDKVILCVCEKLSSYISQRKKTLENKKKAEQKDISGVKNEIKSELKKLCRIESINSFILSKSDTLDEYYIVNFEDIFSLSYDDAMKIFKGQEKIVRMKSPYREALSQSFARSFMRVGIDGRVNEDECKSCLDSIYDLL